MDQNWCMVRNTDHFSNWTRVAEVAYVLETTRSDLPIYVYIMGSVAVVALAASLFVCKKRR